MPLLLQCDNATMAGYQSAVTQIFVNNTQPSNKEIANKRRHCEWPASARDGR